MDNNTNNLYNNFKSRYNDIGKKIKSIAIKQSLIFMISCCIFGLILMFQGAVFVFWGIFLIIIGIFCSSISTFILYGFGELIDKVCQISDSINKLNASDIDKVNANGSNELNSSDVDKLNVNNIVNDSLECAVEENNVINYKKEDADVIKINDDLFLKYLIKSLLIIIGVVLVIYLIVETI